MGAGMFYPNCINSPEKLHYWLDYCTDFQKFRYFVESVLIADSSHLFPGGLIRIIEVFCFYMRGRYPILFSEIDWYLEVVKTCISELYIATLSKLKKEKS